MATALFVGRFQPLHKGHLHIISQALRDNERLVVVVGSAQEKNTLENPLSTEERMRMIEGALGAMGLSNVVLVPLEDFNNNEKWLSELLSRTPLFEVVYAGDNKATEELFSQAGFRVVTHPRYRGISSSAIRERILRGEDWEHMVPASVLDFLRSIGFEDRLKSLAG